MKKEIPNIGTVEYFPEEKIMRIDYAKGIIIDENVMNRVIDEALEIAGDNRFALLINTKDILYVTKEARQISATKEVDKIIASATLVSNTVQKEIFNLYINFSRPLYPVRAFNSEEKALEWLKEQVEKLA